MIDDLIADFTAKQHGLIARWQARGVGITDHALDDRIRRGQLIHVHAGVYRLRGVPYTQELRWLAAVLAGGPHARLSHSAAAALHGFDVRRARPEITVPYSRMTEIPGIDSHRTRRLGDLIVVKKIPVTTKARTILDLAATMRSGFDLFVQNTVNDGLVAIESLLSILDRKGGRGVDGTVLLRDALADGLVDENIQKRLELLIARIVDRARVPKPVRQYELICDDGRQVFLDNAWPDRRIAVEGEGLRWHGNKQQAAKTRARARSITASRWDLYAYGWSDATETPDDMLREIESLFCEGSSGHGPEDPSQNEDAA